MGSGGGGVIDVDAEPPPPPRKLARPSDDSTSRPRGRVRLRPCWARGRPQDQPSSWVRLPEQEFPDGSEVSRWVRERLGCADSHTWLRSLHACLPRAPPGLLEWRLIQFLDCEVEVARDLHQPDFLIMITAALSSLDSGVSESLLHESTSPKLLLDRKRDEVLRKVLVVVEISLLRLIHGSGMC